MKKKTVLHKIIILMMVILFGSGSTQAAYASTVFNAVALNEGNTLIF